MNSNAWNQLSDFLIHERGRSYSPNRQQLLAVVSKGLVATTEFLFAEESRVRESVDALARARIAGRSTPEVEELTEWWYLKRILCAGDTMGVLIEAPLGVTPLLPAPPTALTRAQLLEWALIATWHRRYDHWLKLEAMTLVHQLPFYGMKPWKSEYSS